MTNIGKPDTPRSEDEALLLRAAEIIQWAVDVPPTVSQGQLDEARAIKAALHRALHRVQSETERAPVIMARRIDQLERALKQCANVVRVWHAMPHKPGPKDDFDIYFNHSPEMKLIRDALGRMPEPDDE